MPLSDEEQAKIFEKLSKDDRATLRTGREAKAFLDSKFGEFYIGLLSGAIEAKRSEYESPAETSGDGIAQVLRAESAKGAIMGLRLAKELLNGMVGQAHNLRVQKGLTTTAGDDE